MDTKEKVLAELDRIEGRLQEMVEARGFDWVESIEVFHSVFADVLVAHQEGRDLSGIGPKGYGLTLLAMMPIGMCRRCVADDPDNPDILGLLMVASEALAMCEAEEIYEPLLREMPEAQRAKALSELAKKAAGARHAENREIAARIQAWHADNHHRFTSMDRAAEAVIRIEPVAFRTARKHIGAAAKNLPSARKE